MRLAVPAFAAAACVAGAVAIGVLRRDDGNGRASPTLWPPARAESRIAAAPPPVWVRRRWDVAYVTCSGLGRASRDGGRRLYRRFSCDITVVRPSGDCASTGVYFCVAGYESTVLTRVVRVVDANRYTLG